MPRDKRDYGIISLHGSKCRSGTRMTLSPRVEKEKKKRAGEDKEKKMRSVYTGAPVEVGRQMLGRLIAPRVFPSFNLTPSTNRLCQQLCLLHLILFSCLLSTAHGPLFFSSNYNGTKLINLN